MRKQDILNAKFEMKYLYSQNLFYSVCEMLNKADQTNSEQNQTNQIKPKPNQTKFKQTKLRQTKTK